jgi:sialate O-acetylesterase
MKTAFLSLVFSISGGMAIANVSMPKIFTSNMVLQRDQPLKIWGWADKGEKVTVQLNGQKISTKAGKDGTWQVVLQASAAGGPYDLKVDGKNSLTYTNVLLGDVYICSGQSNMEWILRNSNNAQQEIAESHHPSIRHFTATKATSFTKQSDIAGGEWKESNPQNAGDFSAVAYFFGRKLAKDINVPIGLINSSWGGTNIQTWISWDEMSKDPAFANVDIVKMQNDQANNDKRKLEYTSALKNDKGDLEKWFVPTNATDGWKAMTLPQLWENTDIKNADGIIWFKKEFVLPAGAETKKVTISLGPIDDIDETYINGKLVGKTNGYSQNREYVVDPSYLQPGKNTIVIKVTDTGGGGGLYGKKEQLFVDVNGSKIELAGEWLYKPSVLSTQFGIVETGPNAFPSQLYNAMIAPIINYGIKGGIWYQGESNTYEAYKYRTLFVDLIKDWRAKWGSEFPFFWVQLANFMAKDSLPTQSDWAELREAQSLTLNLPKTGQAVIIDIGEAGDIHPRNKQDVGLRLALAAEKVVYGKEVVFSGPTYQSMKIEGNKAILTFSNVGSGLISKDKYGYLKGFAIAGSDQKFVWAKAFIDGDKVIVYSDAIANPAAVRYAWGNNPDDANFYNKENLPASPFRTDNWKGITQR